jgi:hypothetical protein
MDDGPEIVEAELVEVSRVELDRPRRLAPVVQTAAAAAGGFLAGAATVALAHRLGARRLAAAAPALPPAPDPTRPGPFFREGATYLVTVRTVTRPPL